ncbi:TonB-dependent receptor [Pedobacter sp. PLR]|uniref:TonB-dependent receptor n=1 Tax=Pedobacter sp. PLR TaxID=2994465 RepID=UPI00224820CB|nr:TonB-dependent receptor [Pedobacter sp. PLR]MCX2452245.1 TonB-dependent receptor [Pedobacter sp. PLR]
MKIITIIITISLMQVSAAGFGQKITLQKSNTNLKFFFTEIRKQTGYTVVYQSNLVKRAGNLDVKLKNASLETALSQVLTGNMLSFIIKDKTVIIQKGLPSILYRSQDNFKFIIVKGKVTDEQGKPIPGVTVMVKGKDKGAITDANGIFSINVASDDVLVISNISFQTQEIRVNDKKEFNIVLKESQQNLGEVVVVGYGTQKRTDLTGAVSSINSSQIENKAVSNPLELLRGTVAGFNTNMNTTAKGGGSMEIRGKKSLKASNDPLIVVDGVIYNGALDDINPNDIETIDLLKDGSAAAVYGSRAASGVMAITTKKGKTGKPVINFDMKVGLTQVLHKQDVFNKDEYLLAHGEAQRSLNGYTRPQYYYQDPRDLPAGVDLTTWLGGQAGDPVNIWLTDRLKLQEIERQNYLAGNSINWMDKVFQTGLRQEYNGSVSGKSDMFSYYWSLGSTNNEGIVVGDKYKTIRSRLNLSADITKFLQIGMNTQFANRDDTTNPADWDNVVGLSPYGSYNNPDGTIKWFPHDDNLSMNPFINSAADLLNTNQNIVANLFANVKLPFGIKYQLSFNNRMAWSKNYIFYGKDTYNGRPLPSSIPGINLSGSASRNDGSTSSWQIDNILTWGKTFAGVHRLDLTGLINAEKNRGWSGTTATSQFSPSDALGYHDLGVGAQIKLTTTNSDSYSTGDAMMLRANYAYDNKYLLTASIRRDGFSAFGTKNPRAVFPALAAAWRISNEGFMNKVDWISDLKLRLSYGINGNRSIPIYGALASVSDSKIIIDGVTAIAITNNSLANEDLRWERTTAYNTGLDFGIFNNRIEGTIEAYYMSTKDLLLDRSLPSITGYRSVLSNLGEVTNRGFELTLTSKNIEAKNIKWSSQIVLSANRNEIKHLYGNMVDVKDANGVVTGRKEADDDANGWYIGHAIDQIYGYKVTGVWQENEKDDAAKYGRKPGDVKIQDITNVNGVTAITDIDRVFQGYRDPRFKIGLRNDFTIYDNFMVSFFLRADLGHYSSNSNYLHPQTGYYYDRLNSYKYDYWTPENPINDAARLNSGYNPAPTMWRRSSFVRLQDLTLAYKFPGKLTSKLHVQNARVFLNVNNVYTVSDWDFWDPETKGPTPRIATLGVNFSF